MQRRASICRRWLYCLALTLCQAARAEAQAPELTIEWIFGPQAQAAVATPQVAWLDDGRAMVYDYRTPAARRTFELLDPRTGTRRPAVEPAAAIKGLRRAAGDAVGDTLPWPDGFDSQGRHALYVLGGDLYVLQLPGGDVRRITSTPQEEKAPRLAPDGERLAYVRDNDLFVYDLRTGSEDRLTQDGSETTLNGTLSWLYWEEIFGRNDIGYWWSLDSRSLAYLQTDEAHVPESFYTDFEPARPRVVRQRYPKAGELNPIVRVGVVPATGGPTTWAALPPETTEYVARVTWGAEGGRLAVQTLDRAQDTLRLFFVDPQTGVASEILRETDPAWVNVYDGPFFLRDGSEFLWLSERTGWLHLYRYDSAGRLLNAITSGEWALSPAGPFTSYEGAPVLGVDQRRGLVYFTAERTPIERQLHRARIDGGGLRRLTPSEGFHSPRLSPDARFFVDQHSSLAAPPVVTLHRSDGRELLKLGGADRDVLTELVPSAPELVTIAARDGFELPARILRPPGFTPDQRHPVILNVYGGPSAPSVQDAWWASVLFDQLLANQGFVVVSMDNRSSAGINKTLERSVHRRVYGDVELNDLLDGVRWLKSQPWVDPERLGVWGWSGGGTYTLLAMTRSREFKAGVAVAPATDGRYYDTKWTEFTMERPQDNPEGYDATSLVRTAKDLHGRLLLVHGTYDDNVHPQNTWAFANELIEVGKTFDMMIYPMRKHGIEDTPATIHLFKTMIEFWREHL